MLKKRHYLLLLKLVFIVLAFFIIFNKVDFKEVTHTILDCNWWFLSTAFIVHVIAQIASSLRSRYYFYNEGYEFNKFFAVAMYYVGSFFNIVLPGGIGGDAYKVFLVNKYNGVSNLTAIRLLVSDRASGLYMLIVLTLVVAVATTIADKISYFYYLLLGAFIITSIGYLISIKVLLKEKPFTAIRAVPYSFVVQLGSALVAFFLLKAINFSHGFDINVMANYVAIFLVSAIVTIVPVTIGGAGLRELTFIYAAPIFGISAELGVTIGLLFFLITVANSLFGLVFLGNLERLHKL